MASVTQPSLVNTIFSPSLSPSTAALNITMVTAADQPPTPPPESPPSLDEAPLESPPPESPPSLDEVEEIIAYRFSNKSLLEEALTHHSHPSAVDNLSYDRLEYVGDSVLNLIITKEQFRMYPDLSPGHLTRLRAANVDTEKLARVAIKHGLHKYLRHRKPLLDKQITDFRREIARYPLHSNGLVDAPKALADIVESLIGAVFIDSGFHLDTVWMVFKVLLEPCIDPETLGMHPVTELFELCQKRGWTIELKDNWKESTTYDILVEGKVMGSAAYALKKEIALNRAAKNALKHIQRQAQPDAITAPTSDLPTVDLVDD